MKIKTSLLLVILSLSFVNLPAQATEHEVGGRGGGGVNTNWKKGNKGVPNFPKYPTAARGRSFPAGGAHPVVTHVPARPDSLGNRVTEDHLNRVGFANTRAENIMRNKPRV